MSRLHSYVAVIAAALSSSCAHEVQPTLCGIASDPHQFSGRTLLLHDIIVADTHLDPILVPNSSCDTFKYFVIRFDALDEATKSQFTGLILRLNSANVDGRAGVEGDYTIRLEGQLAPDVWSLALISAQDMRIVPASAKDEAINNQMPASLRRP